MTEKRLCLPYFILLYHSSFTHSMSVLLRKNIVLKSAVNIVSVQLFQLFESCVSAAVTDYTSYLTSMLPMVTAFSQPV